VEVAVAIQVCTGNPADDADNRKIMAHHDDVIGVGMTLDDLLQPRPSALSDIDQSLPAGNLELGRFRAPAA